MSRQSKNKKVIAKRVQVTAVHKAGVTRADGLARAKQPLTTRSNMPQTTPNTSKRKGTCKVIKDKVFGWRRVSASNQNKVASAE